MLPGRVRSIAVAQTCPVRADVHANLDEHLRLTELAASEGAQLVFVSRTVAHRIRSGSRRRAGILRGRSTSRALQLVLLGGKTGAEVEGHDWEYLLTELGLLRVDRALGLGARAAQACCSWRLRWSGVRSTSHGRVIRRHGMRRNRRGHKLVVRLAKGGRTRAGCSIWRQCPFRCRAANRHPPAPSRRGDIV
jgi:hypothetical protein